MIFNEEQRFSAAAAAAAAANNYGAVPGFPGNHFRMLGPPEGSSSGPMIPGCNAGPVAISSLSPNQVPQLIQLGVPFSSAGVVPGVLSSAMQSGPHRVFPFSHSVLQPPRPFLPENAPGLSAQSRSKATSGMISSLSSVKNMEPSSSSFSTINGSGAAPSTVPGPAVLAPRPKVHLRKAAGTVWSDSTLDEWGSNDFRVFCGDLGNEVTDELLSNAFKQFKSFQKARVIRDKRTGKGKGYGFVSFGDPHDMLRALKEMDKKYVGNRPIRVVKSRWKEREISGVVKKKRKGEDTSHDVMGSKSLRKLRASREVEQRKSKKVKS